MKRRGFVIFNRGYAQITNPFSYLFLASYIAASWNGGEDKGGSKHEKHYQMMNPFSISCTTCCWRHIQ